MIACQVTATNQTIGSLMNNVSGKYDFTTVYQWKPSITNYLIDNGDSSLGDPATGWDNAGTITLNPGQATWLFNPNSFGITNTFVGQVPQGTNPVPIVTGFNMLSSPVPFSGDLVTNMGLTNYNDLDTVFVYTPSITNYVIYNVDISLGSSGYMNQWDSGDPQLNVGQGFWYQANAPFTWTQIFFINP